MRPTSAEVTAPAVTRTRLPLDGAGDRQAASGTRAHTGAARWSGLLRAGGVAALLIAALLIAEIAVYAVLARSETAAEHFAVFERDWLAGLLTLDLLGMVAYVLLIPTTLALYVTLHRGSEGLMLVATALLFMGIATFFSTNTALPLLAVAQQYAWAATDAEREALLAAGTALFALFNETAFLTSYVMVSAAWAMIGIGMLRSGRFGRTTAYTGILAGGAGTLAVVLEHAAEALVAIAIPVYFAAIVFLLAWMVLTGSRLLRLSDRQSKL